MVLNKIQCNKGYLNVFKTSPISESIKLLSFQIILVFMGQGLRQRLADRIKAIRLRRQVGNLRLEKARARGTRLSDAWAILTQREKLQALEGARRRAGVTKIVVKNNALALFNVGGEHPINVDLVGKEKYRKYYGQSYNEEVPNRNKKYYLTGKRKAPVVVVGVVTPCIVFLAYTRGKAGEIDRAGVFHYYTDRSKIRDLINEVSNGRDVFVKAVGAANLTKKGKRKTAEWIRKELRDIGEHVHLKGLKLGFGGASDAWAIEVYPLSGEIRYFSVYGKPRMKRL